MRVVCVCLPPFSSASGLAQLSWNSKNSSPGNQLLTIQFTLPLTLQLPSQMAMFYADFLYFRVNLVLCSEKGNVNELNRSSEDIALDDSFNLCVHKLFYIVVYECS